MQSPSINEEIRGVAACRSTAAPLLTPANKVTALNYAPTHGLCSFSYDWNP